MHSIHYYTEKKTATHAHTRLILIVCSHMQFASVFADMCVWYVCVLCAYILYTSVCNHMCRKIKKKEAIDEPCKEIYIKKKQQPNIANILLYNV